MFFVAVNIVLTYEVYLTRLEVTIVVFVGVVVNALVVALLISVDHIIYSFGQ